MEIFIFAVLLGLIPAAIASHKGRSFGVWWAYGTLLFIVVLPMALLMKPKVAAAQAEALDGTKAKTRPDNFVPGWLVLVVFVLLGGFIWFMSSNGSSGSTTPAAAAQSETVRSPTMTPTPAGAPIQAQGFSVAQSNAVRSAKQYLSMQGFSRAGLIQQLSSNVGDGYTVADATVAVDSLNIDWNEEAVRSAKQYLSMQGFSCRGLIQQLSSSVGDGYTVSQATYGAEQTGVCQ
jgi:hypothetical protein